ncbi:Rieske (2Fe-2S) protein [Georgenia sp. SYP-B2076]|uniref:Rieske (2Fe-2S) protein n=1 Tax=Georgenia sp. SYP-B2076 TaxID=2495881 RepID=UPI000F8C6E78|nr:Rieske (2Fe-2S) protein [Georgenia sp. SYP-B2076]
MPTGTMSRRSALHGLAIAVAAAVAGYVAARVAVAGRPQNEGGAANAYGMTAAPAQRLATLDQVPPGGGLVLTQSRIVLTRDAGGTVRGFSAVCTHQGCTVATVTAEAIVCPCHGSRFSPRTGAVLGGPAPRPLPAVSVTVRDRVVYTL